MFHGLVVQFHSVLPAQNPDVAIERVEFEFRPALAGADAEELVTLVNKLPAFDPLRGFAGRKVTDRKIGIDLAVKRLEEKIRRESREKADLDIAVERAEIAFGVRIGGELHAHFAVER